MLFKMYNPRACDEVCGSAVCLGSCCNNVWQLHRGSAAEIFFIWFYSLLQNFIFVQVQPTYQTYGAAIAIEVSSLLQKRHCL